MNDYYVKYTELLKKHEVALEEINRLKAKCAELSGEAQYADDFRQKSEELEILINRQRSEIEMLKECIVRMVMDREGVR